MVFRHPTAGTLYLTDSTCPASGRASKLNVNPDDQKAEPSVKVVQEMEWNAGKGKEEPSPSKEEGIELLIHDDNAEESGSRKDEHLDS